MRSILFALVLSFICAAALADTQTILVFGDSLSAGLGMPREKSWPALLEDRLVQRHYPYRVVNASISGETTSGGLARLPGALAKFKPAIVIIELGANDGLRGLAVNEMRSNLDAMIRQSQARRVKVLLIGIRLPPNYGGDYTRKFADSYAELGRRYQTALLPFLFEGFAENRDAFQADGLHPTAAMQPTMLDSVWRVLLPLLSKR
ncbi:esterase TesA precursor [mine drainage metagenome]|uniref:Esterase TesA n=1 Tax=mine drainage metagenome TaxID=410659 RepID=A0A1J5SBR3_9ZZZZ